MRLFTGDIERGCSGTTPGRKLKGKKKPSASYLHHISSWRTIWTCSLPHKLYFLCPSLIFKNWVIFYFTSSIMYHRARCKPIRCRHRAQVVHLPWDTSADSADSSSISMADSLATAFHILIEPRDGMLLFPSALFWHWAPLPKLVLGYRKYHTPLLYVWVHSTTQKIAVKADLDKYITTLKNGHWWCLYMFM